MCMNCGCGQVDDRHGNQANIVADDLRQAASASGQDMPTTVSNMRHSLDQMEQGRGRMGMGMEQGSGHAGGYGSSSGAMGQGGSDKMAD